jgi:hypothetical protein
MQLQLWMRRERHTDASFIKEVNKILEAGGHKPLTWRSVLPWRRGQVIPRPAVIEAIAAVTQGEVGYGDHVAKNAELKAAAA